MQIEMKRTAWIAAMAGVLLSAGTLGSGYAWADEVEVPGSEMSGLEETLPEQQAQEVTPDDPTQGPYEQAKGFYSNGSLVDAMNFGLEGLGFVKLFQPRDRGWAAFDLIRVIEIAAERLHSLFPTGERVQIGDASSEHGGRLSRHASHQNGLDVDIAFLRLDNREQDPQDMGGFDESFVRRNRPSANFDTERNYLFMRYLFETGRINRIFVDKALKSELCRYSRELGQYGQDIEYLRRLRPWPHHDDHMHVRITCPVNSPNCVTQQDPPLGSGCDNLLYQRYKRRR